MASLKGVEVLTWGSHPGGGNGLMHFLDTELFGGNVGHAAIKVTFPADAEGDRLIKQYCTDPEIPHVKTTHSTKGAVLDKATGEYKKGDKAVFEETVYEVYFSWWPGAGKYSLEDTINGDSEDEREGVHVEMSDEWRAILNPEQRRHTGRMGHTVMTYGPEYILHTRDLPQKDIDAMMAKRRLKSSQRNIESINVLLSKLKAKKTVMEKGPVTLSTTAIILLNRFIPGWDKDLENNFTITPEQRDELYQQALKTKAKLGEISNLVAVKKIKQALKLLNESEGEDLDVDDELEEALNEIEDYLWEDETWEDQVEDEGKLSAAEVNRLIALCQTEVEKRQTDRIEATLIIHRLREAVSALKEADATGIDVDDELQTLLDDCEDYIDLHGGEDWESLVADDDKLTLHEVQSFIKAFEEQIEIRQDQFIAFKTELLDEEYEAEARYLTLGHPPDSRIRLPIRDINDPTKGNTRALDVESMLKQMQTLIQPDAEEFNLFRKNCSKTVDSILEAGSAHDPYLQNYFKGKALGFFGNPQEVYNHCLDFRHAIDTDEHSSFITPLLRFSPIKGMSGALIGYIMDEKNSKAAKALAWIGLVLVGILATPGVVIKSVFNPLKTFNQSTGLIGAVFSRNSTTLKVTATIFLGPIAIVASVPAGVQFLLKKLIVNPLKALFSSKQPSVSSVDAISHITGPDKKRRDTNVKIRQDMNVKMKANIDKVKVMVDDPSVEAALDEFERILKTDPNAIPVFTSQTTDRILKKLQTNDFPKLVTQYEKICNLSLGRIKKVQLRLLEEEEHPTVLHEVNQDKQAKKRYEELPKGRLILSSKLLPTQKLPPFEEVLDWALDDSQDIDAIRDVARQYKNALVLIKRVEKFERKKNLKQALREVKKAASYSSFQGDPKDFAAIKAHVLLVNKERQNNLTHCFIEERDRSERAPALTVGH